MVTSDFLLLGLNAYIGYSKTLKFLPISIIFTLNMCLTYNLSKEFLLTLGGYMMDTCSVVFL